jgi:acetylornithine/N-succinyldiaminopimelate aminotransferase
MNFIKKESEQFFHTYKRIPLDVDRGEGVYLITKEGARYLDLFAGIAVNALGYNHPSVIAAIMNQAQKYVHVSNFFYQDPQLALADRLLRASGFSKVFFTNSGTEAMEGSLKLARKWGRTLGKTTIFGLTGSFHGRTFGSLSVTGREKYRNGYEPFLPDTRIIKFNDIDDLRENVNEKTLAVVIEFIQGESGINLVDRAYSEALARLREQFDFLVIADEIQSGLGRTGKFFAFQHFHLKPDIVVLAKAIGGGLPLGAILGTEKLENVFSPGTHGTTFGGNPVSCAAGLATLEEILDHGVMQNAELVGSYLKERLTDLMRRYPGQIEEVRGLGLMLGVQMKFDANQLVEELRESKVLANVTENTVLRFIPPLILSKEDVDVGVDAIGSLLEHLISPNRTKRSSVRV